MPDIAHIATSLATDPLAGLLLAIPLSIALIVLAQRLWWIHALLVTFFLILSLAFHDKRHLAWRLVLRSPDRKAHISYGEARLLLAYLP